jgi:hypothetical protein
MKTKKILLSVLFTLLTIRIVLMFFNIHFTSVYGEELFFFSLSLIGIIAWLISLRTNNDRFILFGGAVGVYGLLVVVVSIINSMLIDEERRPEHFKNTDLMVSRQSGFGLGSGPYFVFSLGKTYLWGLLYQEDISFREGNEAPPHISGAFEIPEGMKNPNGRDCWLLKERNWLLDFETKTLYKLKKRKPIKLSTSEKTWRYSWEKELNAKVFIGKGTSDIDEIYQLPTTIYVTLDFLDTNYVKNLNNAAIERLTSKIAESLKPVLDHAEDYKTAEVYFVAKDSRDIYIGSKYDFDENQQYKKGRYNLKANAIIPNELGVDYIKFLYIPHTPFLSIEYNDGRNDDQKAWINYLSSELHHINDIGHVQKTGETLYKGMICEVYEGKNSWKIRLENGYLTNSFRFVLYNGEVVEAKMNYSCFKTNDAFTYGEVVDKLTDERKRGSNKPKDQFYKYVNRDYLKFYYETDEIIINCKADTASFPWKISYTTSITEPQFVYLYKEIE